MIARFINIVVFTSLFSINAKTQCSVTILSVTASSANSNSNTFQISGTYTYTGAPSAGFISIVATNGSVSFSLVQFPPFVNMSVIPFILSGVPADGSQWCITISFTAQQTCSTVFCGISPSSLSLACSSSVGVFNSTSLGSTTIPTILCYDDTFQMNPVSGFVPPPQANSPPNPSGYNPGIGYLVYSCPPTVGLSPTAGVDISSDPCFIGVSDFGNLSDYNDLYWINAYPGIFTNNIVYFVPVTYYNTISSPAVFSYTNSINPCYHMGTPIPVQYLTEITTDQIQNCLAGTVTTTISGSRPALDGSLFSVIPGSLLPTTASFNNTTCINNGTIAISGLANGDNYSFQVQTTNSCVATISGAFTGADPSDFSYPNQIYCTNDLNPTPTIIGLAGGTFSVFPSGLTFVNSTSGEIDMATSVNNSYTITYTTTGACPSSSQQTITITNAPSGGFSYPQSAYCTNDLNASPIFVPSASVGILTSSPAGLTLSNTGEISMSSSSAGTYTITNTVSGGSCPTVTEISQVTINAAPTVSLNPFSSVCITDPSFQLVGGIPAMGMYSGPGVNSGIFSPVSATAGTHTITYTYVNNNNCQAEATQTITVSSIPTLSMAPFSGELCENDQPISLPIATPSGGVYSGNGVSGSNFDPSISGNGTFQVTYTFTSAEGCEASAFQPVVVNETPVVTLGALSGTCVDYAAFALTGGSPSGGNYAGPGVGVGGIFDPAIAGVGAHTITYNFISAEGCDGTAQQTISVDACASIQEIDEINALIYPNPANEIIHVVLDNKNNEKLTISLISLDGKEVLINESNQQNIHLELSISEFSKGIYFVQIQSDSGKMNKKVVLH